MCTDCNELTIPTGATGATGPQGPTGPAGANGSNGTHGVDGTTVVDAYNDLTGVGTDADLLEKTLYTYTVNANTLSINGDELEAYIYYAYTSPDDTILRVKFGVKTITINVAGAQNTLNFLKVKISRISATSQLWTMEQTTMNGLGAKTIGYFGVDSSTADLTLGQAFEVSGQNDKTATANQLVLRKCSLYLYKK